MRTLLSHRLVRVSAEDRLNDVSSQIAAREASHCIVTERPSGQFLGVVRVREAAMLPIGRIFADLISPVPTYRVAKKLPATRLVELLDRENLEDVVVLSGSGKFVGLVTRESLCDWQVKERVRNQATLERRATGKEQIVARLGRKVRAQTAALKAAVAQLEEFSYAISHDVRTPLRAIRGYAVALQEDQGPRLDETAKEYVRRIITASDRLDRLTLGILSYRKVSRSRVVLRRLNLEGIVARAVAEKQGAAPHATIQVELPLAPVQGSRRLLGQCISELLDNALKFTAGDRSPLVRIWTERRGNEILLWVEDNGLGVGSGQRERIFHLFGQIHGDRAFEGIGAGLATVRRAMEKMGGAVGVEANDGHGSRFWLRFRS